MADLSHGMIDQARHNLAGDPPRFHFAVVDAQAIPFPDVSFDAVIANHMLYHVPDIPRALAEVRRVLRPGGRIIAATNGDGHLREIDQLLQRFDPALDTWHSSFTLENGADWLAPHFTETTMDRYTDALEVTEAPPLIAYLLSGVAAGSLSAEQRDEFEHMIEQEIAVQGTIHISKDSGLFAAWR